MKDQPRILVVGAGMSGIAMAIVLKQAGFTEIEILEKGSSVGGTWRENTYPGIACDVHSRVYTYSFAPNPNWTRVLPPGREIKEYFERVHREFGLVPLTRFDTEVVDATWDDDHWTVRTADGATREVDVLIAACGILHRPRMPDIPGLEDFAGPAFHTARWDHSAQIAGRRVGLIGTGATGTQITTALGGVAQRLTVFQRTAQWVLPLPNRRFTRMARFLYNRFPGLNERTRNAWISFYDASLGVAAVRPGWQRQMFNLLMKANLRRVKDPELRRKLTPTDLPLCRRLVMSWDFYPAIQRPDVELVTEGIERIEPNGVRTVDGVLHELDVLVLATGFDARAFVRPIELHGQNGVRLSEVWGGAPKAYRTVAMPEFPNFFMLLGPNSPVGNQSLVTISEAQAKYILTMIEGIRDGRYRFAAPQAGATRRFNDDMKEAMPNTIWTSGCTGWYLGEDGVPMLWPWTPQEHTEMMKKPDLSEYELA